MHYATQLRPLQRSDRETLVDVFARAFAQDPLTDWFVLGGALREWRIQQIFHWYFDEALGQGLSQITVDRRAAALWLAPGQWHLPLWRQAVLLPKMLKVVGVRKLPSRLRGINVMEQHHPTDRHYYLVSMATDPSRQGQGLGSALLSAGLSRCDKAGMPAYLEATSERNLPLYKRHGFQVRECLRIPGDGPMVWLMWRAPKLER